MIDVKWFHLLRKFLFYDMGDFWGCEQYTFCTAVPFTCFLLFIQFNIQIFAIVVRFPKGILISRWRLSRETCTKVNVISASSIPIWLFLKYFNTITSSSSEVKSVENFALRIIFILFWGWNKPLFRKFSKKLLIFVAESGPRSSHFLLVHLTLG